MKIYFTILILIGFLSCKKEKKTNCFQIKYIDGFCYTNIYQIVSPTFQHLGQTNWIRPRDGKLFNYVFVLENHCEDLSYIYNTTDSTYTVRLLNENEIKNTTCFTCYAAYINPPSKSLALKSTNCDE